MRRMLGRRAGLGVVIAALALAWAGSAGAAPVFSVAPNPASGPPGTAVDFVLSVSGAEDFGLWEGFVVEFGSTTGLQDPAPPGAPDFPFVTLDTTGGLTAGSLIGVRGAFFDLIPVSGENNAACAGVVGCVTVADFTGLKAPSGDLLGFRLVVGPGTPAGADILVTFAVTPNLGVAAGVAVQGATDLRILAVPEPSGVVLLTAGIALLMFARRTRLQGAAAKVS